MKYARLGSSDLLVSEVCLGTMTWGVQNTEADAHAQLDYALSRGVNFIDTAERYPIPESYPGHIPGTTESIIGSYLEKHPDVRSKLIIATKVMGYVRNSRIPASRRDSSSTVSGTDNDNNDDVADCRLDASSIHAACTASLRRLRTSYIDLYQLHTPDRYVPLFGARDYRLSRERDDAVPICETLTALKELLNAGKIRAYGLANETTFGVCEYVRIADELDMPRPASIQNAFCLLNRQFECELAEACAPRNFNIGLLPWSALGAGSLTGKYTKLLSDDDEEKRGKGLEKCRLVRFQGFQGRFLSRPALEAVRKYERVAEGAGMAMTKMALAFCKSRWYVASTLIGATGIEQLRENIDAFEIELDDHVLRLIDDVHNENKDISLEVR